MGKHFSCRIKSILESYFENKSTWVILRTIESFRPVTFMHFCFFVANTTCFAPKTASILECEMFSCVENNALDVYHVLVRLHVVYIRCSFCWCIFIYFLFGLIMVCLVLSFYQYFVVFLLFFNSFFLYLRACFLFFFFAFIVIQISIVFDMFFGSSFGL